MWPTRLFAALSPDEARNRVASVSVDTAPRRCRWSSSPEELHLQALTEPCLKVSPYTALRGVESAPSREHPVSGGQRFLLVAQLTKAAIEPRHPLRSPPLQRLQLYYRMIRHLMLYSYFPFRGSRL